MKYVEIENEQTTFFKSQMKTMKLDILICTSLFILSTMFFSCEKDKNYNYSGRILSYGTLEPISDAVVYIIAGKAVGILEPAQEWVLDSVKTDASGKFRITTKEGDYHRIGKISKEGYYSDLPGQVTSLVTGGPLANKDYIIDPQGVLHVIIENDPNVEGDYIRFWGSFTGTSLTNDHSKKYIMRANRIHDIYYKTEEIPSNLFRDSVFVEPFDTTYLRIKF